MNKRNVPLKAESGNNIVAQRVKPAAAFTTPTTRRAALIQVLAAFFADPAPCCCVWEGSESLAPM